MILRPAQPADAAPLAALGRDSFCAAFAHLYDPVDLGQFLDHAYSVAAVSDEIANPAITYRLAEANGALVGYCKLRDPSPYGAHSDAAHPIALSQLYTAPDATGQGIGQVLMDWALEEARERGRDAVQLSVWSGNTGAQRFYARHGFTKIADIDFWVGNHRDDEFLLELRL